MPHKQITYITLQSRRQGTAGYAHVTEIISGLEKRGWHVRLFEPAYKTAISEPGAMVRLIEFIKIQCRALLRNARPRLFYLRSHFALLPVTIYAKMTGIPVVHEINGPYEDLFIAWPFTQKLSWLITRVVRYQYRMSHALITVTPDLGHWLRKEVGHKQIHIIPNGANTDIFKPTTISNTHLPETYALFFGALAPWQGIDTILEAMDLYQWPKQVGLVIAGDGAARSQVQDRSKRNRKIVYLGKVLYKTMPGIISGAMVSLSPQSNTMGRSNTGLFPLKLFESLACGVPVVVTDFPGQSDLVRKYDCGLVIPHDDPRALAQAVSHIFQNPKEGKLMGDKGRKAVHQEHSWDKRAADTDKVLRNLFSNI
jgi:glycosyltransferase involved in cell wall biosynthesis